MITTSGLKMMAAAMANNNIAALTPLEQVQRDYPVGASIQVCGEEYYGPATVTKVGLNMLGTPLVHISRYDGDTSDLAFYAHECRPQPEPA